MSCRGTSVRNYHYVPRDSPEERSLERPCPLSKFQGHMDEHQEIPFKLSYVMPLDRSGAKMGTSQGKLKIWTLRYAGRGRYVGVSTANQCFHGKSISVSTAHQSVFPRYISQCFHGKSVSVSTAHQSVFPRHISQCFHGTLVFPRDISQCFWKTPYQSEMPVA
jgi:hypothetical protein